MCERIEQGFARSHGGRARFFSDACLQGEPASCAAEQARGLANCVWRIVWRIVWGEGERCRTEIF